MRRAFALLVALAAPLAGPAAAQELNDFPTNARAEYVFACMATNGQNRDMLDRCSCAIDQIAEVLPYDGYVEAETVLRMQQTTGERAGMFKSMPQLTNVVADLKRAEAEAEILCF
jgi:lysyl-tRNA synthetase class II